MLELFSILLRLLTLQKLDFLRADELDKNIKNLIVDLVNDKIKMQEFYNFALLKNPTFQKANLKSNLKTRINWINKHTEFKTNILDKKAYQIKKVYQFSKNIVALVVARQSVDKGYSDKQDLAVSNGIRYAKQNNMKYEIFRTTHSGLTFASLIKEICRTNPNIHHIFLESADRLSRNMLDCALFLDYCAKNRISIYINGQVMNRGQNRMLLFTSIVFADKQLTDNQTLFNNVSYNLVKFELGLISYDCLNDKEIQLFDKMQNVTVRDFLIKTMNLSIKYIDNYENKTTKKNGVRFANNEDHYKKALEIVEMVKQSEYYDN